MRSILLTLAFALSVSSVAQAQQAADPETRAQEILKQARAAIWDEAKTGPLQSISLDASRRLAHRGNQIDMTFEALLPDKFMQTVVINLGLGFGNDLILIRTINGPQAWSEVISPGGSMAAVTDKKKKVGDGDAALRKVASNMTNLAARMAAELSGMPDDFGKTDDGSGPRSADQPLVIQVSFTPLLLVLLLTSPPLLPIEFSYAGQAKTQDGQTADALDLKGPHNFSARLFLDRQTRRTLMLTYKTKIPSRSAGGQVNDPAPPKQADADEIEVEARWTALDYRNINGLTLPRRLTRYTGGQIVEEIEIQKVKVNPALKPDKFMKKEKQK
jgi:hypothetical protein